MAFLLGGRATVGRLDRLANVPGPVCRDHEIAIIFTHAYYFWRRAPPRLPGAWPISRAVRIGRPARASKGLAAPPAGGRPCPEDDSHRIAHANSPPCALVVIAKGVVPEDGGSAHDIADCNVHDAAGNPHGSRPSRRQPGKTSLTRMSRFIINVDIQGGLPGFIAFVVMGVAALRVDFIGRAPRGVLPVREATRDHAGEACHACDIEGRGVDGRGAPGSDEPVMGPDRGWAQHETVAVRSARGGTLATMANYRFEVFFYATGVRVFVFVSDPAGTGVSASGAEGDCHVLPPQFARSLVHPAAPPRACPARAAGGLARPGDGPQYGADIGGECDD